MQTTEGGLMQHNPPSFAPTLDTPRLRIRPHKIEDFEALVSLYQTPRSRYIGGPLPRGEVWNGFVDAVGQWALFGFGGWGIERREDGVLLGQVAIAQPPHFPEIELGWLLFEGFEGQGYASEAVLRVLDFARSTYGWTSLVSYIDPDNVGSIRLATRLGAFRDLQAATPNNDPTLVYRYDLKND